MEVVTCDKLRCWQKEVISPLSCMVSLFQLQKLRRPKGDQGLWLLYADSLYWRSVWKHKEATIRAKGLMYFTLDKKETQQRERHLLVSFFLLARTRFVIPPADFFSAN